MKSRFRLYRRTKTGVFYIHDGDTGKQESLGTRDCAEAKALLASRNEAIRQPQLNLQIARTYLAASDPQSTQRTWKVPLEELAKTKSGSTHDRWISVLKDTAFDAIRNLTLLETRAEHLLRVMESGTVSTNVFLRRVHNFALDVGWLPWPRIPKKHWPKIKFGEKRAITADEHQAILSHQPKSTWRAYLPALLNAQSLGDRCRVSGCRRRGLGCPRHKLRSAQDPVRVHGTLRPRGAGSASNLACYRAILPKTAHDELRPPRHRIQPCVPPSLGETCSE